MKPLQPLEQELNQLLERLSLAQLRPVMAEIAQYLKQRNQYRIAHQLNTDGSAYARRKPNPQGMKAHRKSAMLQGFKPFIRHKVGIDQVQVGIFGKPAHLARIHHQGQTEEGIKYPARNLVGLSDADTQAVINILLKHLNA